MIARFYRALAIFDLVNERSLTEVSEDFQIPSGQLQALQQSAGQYAGMITGWFSL